MDSSVTSKFQINDSNSLRNSSFSLSRFLVCIVYIIMLNFSVSIRV